jgi:hypothetical protein
MTEGGSITPGAKAQTLDGAQVLRAGEADDQLIARRSAAARSANHWQDNWGLSSARMLGNPWAVCPDSKTRPMPGPVGKSARRLPSLFGLLRWTALVGWRHGNSWLPQAAGAKREHGVRELHDFAA